MQQYKNTQLQINSPVYVFYMRGHLGHFSQISLRGTTEWSERNNFPLLHIVEWEYKVALDEVEIPSNCLSKWT